MRNRWMYYATGLPGWMRFGFSPGWIGRSPTGLGPCASYLMTGQWPTPQAQAYWQNVQSGQATYPQYGGMGAYPPPFAPDTQPGVGMGFPPGVQPGMAPEVPKEQELEWLKNQAQMLGQQLEQINSRIEQLEEVPMEEAPSE